MSTVLICRELPYPPNSGSPLRMWQQLNLLAQRGPVHLVTFSGLASGLSEMPIAARWEEIVATDYEVRHWPGPLRILRALIPPQYPSSFGEFADGAINARLKRFIDEASPTHVILSHWNSAMPAILNGRRRKFSIILDSHNVEWKLHSDRRSERGLVARIRNWGFRRREKSLFELADKSWVTSEDDRSSASSLAPTAAGKIMTWPNAIDIDSLDASLADTARVEAPLDKQWPTLIFVGYMAYEPNEQAALVAINEIFPIVRSSYPNARLLLVGKDPRPELYEAANHDPNIIITGTVPDVLPYLALADLAIVPLTVGGGTRLKILEALAARVPIVSTSKGAEGIAAAGSQEVLIEDDLGAMGAKVVELLRDTPRRDAQIQAGRALVEANFSWRALAARLERSLRI